MCLAVLPLSFGLLLLFVKRVFILTLDAGKKRPLYLSIVFWVLTVYFSDKTDLLLRYGALMASI